MIQKTLRTVFFVAVAIGAVSFMVRMKDAPPARPSPVATKPADPTARPLASFRVVEDSVSKEGIDFRAANYKARIGVDACVFGGVPEQGSVWATREFNVAFGTPRLEQGSRTLECKRGDFQRAGFGLVRLNHESVTEEYLFENARVEQLYRIPERIGDGDLRFSIPVTSDLDGAIANRAPGQNAFIETQFSKGGIAFCDAAGVTRLAYHSAVVADANGHELALVPKYENGAIHMEIPASFMDHAAYPVVIDPWLDFAGSGTGTGVSGAHGHTENPQLALTEGGQPFICWADDSAAAGNNNTDIYLRWWNGFEFFALGSPMNPGGLSNTPGKSTHPSLSLGATGTPTVAWEDDSIGPISILVRHWPLKDEPGVGSWSERESSGTGQGVSFQFSPALHPSVSNIMAFIPGVITVDSNGNPTGSSPSSLQSVPVVAYDLPQSGGTQIIVQIFYPGAPAQPQTTGTPALPPVPAGWYPAEGAGVFKSAPVSISNTPTGSISQYPSLGVDVNGGLHVAWEDTRNGNFETYYARATATSSYFLSVNTANTNEVDTNGFNAWSGIGGSNGGGGVSNTTTPSQFPSLSVDNFGAVNNINVTIAWQETEAAVPPNPGTTSQIYAVRSVNGGAFAGLDGSNTTGGISKTLNHASTPSVDANGGYAAVAWADDSNGRSSIYMRRIFLGIGGSGHWDQVGFQGSAFPAINGETFAPIGGISLSSNYSIQPSLKLDQFGSPIVAWADGSAANFSILAKLFSPNGPGIAVNVGTPQVAFQTTLRQTLTDPTLGAAVDVPLAGFVNGTTVFLSSRVFTETLNPAGSFLILQLEVQAAGNPFTNSPNFQTLFVAPDDPTTTPANLAVFKFDGLPNANYHWQGRTIDQIGRSSPWITFPTDSNGASFRVNVSAPPGSGGSSGGGSNGPVNTGGTGSSSHSKGNCGLLGLEGVALMGLLRLIRRKK